MRLSAPVRPGSVDLGGQTYATSPETVDARLDISRPSAGYALRLRFSLRLEGPCMRCLESAAAELEIDVREVDQPAIGDEELGSPYVRGGHELDAGSWAHDAVVLALPGQILCRPNCAGLCPGCGVSLNDADPAEHRHEQQGDPRWAKLRELQADE